MYHISKDKRSKESSMWIYEALVRLLQNTDYKAIRITDICDEAKLGRVTFYRHYDSIDDVLRKKCDELFEGMIQYIMDNIRHRNEPAFFLKHFLSYWYANASFLTMIYKADRAFILGEALEFIINKIKFKIKLIQPESRFDSYFLAIRSAIPLAILAQWARNGFDIPPEELSSALSQQLQDIISFANITGDS